VESPTVETGDPESVGVARASTASLGEEHDGETEPFGDVEEAVLLPVILGSLRSGQHGVVVRHHHHPSTVDGRQPTDESVGRGLLDQLVQRPSTTLGRDDQGAVLDQSSRIDEIGHVLARRATSRPTALLGGFRSGRVVDPEVSTRHLGEVGSLGVVVEVGRRFSTDGIDEGDPHQDVSLVDRGSDLHQRFGHENVTIGDDVVLHLHRLDHHHRSTSGDPGPHGHDGEHRAPQR